MVSPKPPDEGFCSDDMPLGEGWPTEIPDFGLAYDLSSGLLNSHDHFDYQDQNIDVALHVFEKSDQVASLFPSPNLGDTSAVWPPASTTSSFHLSQTQAPEGHTFYSNGYIPTGQIFRPGATLPNSFESPIGFHGNQDEGSLLSLTLNEINQPRIDGQRPSTPILNQHTSNGTDQQLLLSKGKLHVDNLVGVLPNTRKRTFCDNTKIYVGSCINAFNHQIDTVEVVAEDSTGDNAVDLIKYWLVRNPNVFPRAEHVQALAILSSLSPRNVELLLNQILREKPLKEPEVIKHSQLKEPESKRRKAKPTAALVNQVADTVAEHEIFQAAALWLRERPPKCWPASESKISLRNVTKKYQCTLGCGAQSHLKHTWKRHEEQNYPQEGWICNLGVSAMVNGVLTCVYCNTQDPETDHAINHHRECVISKHCKNKPLNALGRIFLRKDRFFSHLKEKHPSIPPEEYVAQSHFVVDSRFPRQCGFCRTYHFRHWLERIKHLSLHFERGSDMSSWNSEVVNTLELGNEALNFSDSELLQKEQMNEESTSAYKTGRIRGLQPVSRKYLRSVTQLVPRREISSESMSSLIEEDEPELDGSPAFQKKNRGCIQRRWDIPVTRDDELYKNRKDKENYITYSVKSVRAHSGKKKQRNITCGPKLNAVSDSEIFRDIWSPDTATIGIRSETPAPASEVGTEVNTEVIEHRVDHNTQSLDPNPESAILSDSTAPARSDSGLGVSVSELNSTIVGLPDVNSDKKLLKCCQRPLPPEKLRKTRLARTSRACWMCYLKRIICSLGDPCQNCRINSISLLPHQLCSRSQFAPYGEVFFPGGLASHLDRQDIERLVSEYSSGSVESNMVVQITTGLSFPSIILEVRIFKPDTSGLLVNKQHATEIELSGGEIRPIHPQIGVLGTYLPDLKKKCLVHIRDMVSCSSFITATVDAETPPFSRMAILAVHKFYRNEKHQLLGKALMLYAMHHFLNRRIIFTSVSGAELSDGFANISSKKLLSARVLSRQVKYAMFILLKEWTKKVISELDTEMRARTVSSLPVTFGVCLVLCLCVETTQTSAFPGICNALWRSNNSEPAWMQYVKTYLDLEDFQSKLTSIFHSTYITRIKPDLKSYNSLEDGLIPDGGFNWNELEGTFITEIRECMKNHKLELLEFAMKPKLDETTFTLSQQQFQKYNRGRLLSKYLASFISVKRD